MLLLSLFVRWLLSQRAATGNIIEVLNMHVSRAGTQKHMCAEAMNGVNPFQLLSRDSCCSVPIS